MDILKTFNDDDLKNIGIYKYGALKQILNSIASLEHQGKIFYSMYFQTLVISKYLMEWKIKFLTNNFVLVTRLDWWKI